jgi:hypothetical protein
MSIQSVILLSYAEEDIPMAKVWLITGRGNGLGRDIVEAARSGRSTQHVNATPAL